MKDRLGYIKKMVKEMEKSRFEIKCQVLKDGRLPERAHPSDSGMDVFATSDIIVRPGQVIKHPLNIRFELPEHSWARVETKSGLGAKGLLVYAGVIDRGYRGIVHAIMTNLNRENEEGIVIKKGDKLAQITINPHSENFYIVKVNKVSDDTDRGDKGFGSTGK